MSDKLFPVEKTYKTKVASADVLLTMMQNAPEQMLYLFLVKENLAEAKSHVVKVMFNPITFSKNETPAINSYWLVCKENIFVRMYVQDIQLGLCAVNETNSALFSDFEDATEYLMELQQIEQAFATLKNTN